MLNMQVEKKELSLTKHNSSSGVLSAGRDKDSIYVQLKDDIPVPRSSFLQRSYSVLSFSLSTEAQACDEEEDGSQSSFLSNMLCLFPFASLLVNTNKRGAKTSWNIPSDFLRDLVPVGSGAHGSVFRGFLHGEAVAVKEAIGELKADVKLLKKLKHPNIVKIIGICTDSPHVRVVMEYCHYGSLYDELYSGTGISPGKALSWAEQIAEGMNYLHKHKVIHRDLKSPNILIGYNDVLKITDFDTSCRWNGFSTEMSCYGTYRWMAPEVIRNELCSEKVDIWSYGVVVWELLTSEIPYKNLEALQVMFGVGNGSIHLHVPGSFPKCFKYLLGQCWNRNPIDRPSFHSILKHLQLETTEEEINDLNVSEYHDLQVQWKSEVNPDPVKCKSFGSSSESDDHVDCDSDVFLQLCRKMHSMFDLLCYKEWEISKRKCDLQTKLESLSHLCKEEVHRSQNQNWRCCSKARRCCSKARRYCDSRREDVIHCSSEVLRTPYRYRRATL